MFAKYFATLVLQHLSVRVPVLHATCRMQQQKLQQQLRRCVIIMDGSLAATAAANALFANLKRPSKYDKYEIRCKRKVVATCTVLHVAYLKR